MPLNSVQAKKVAKDRPRDPQGHFLKAKASSSTPLDNIPAIPEFEKPLVEVAITNPFRKILYWLDQIRRRQTTTFAFKLSIPLIALPLVIAGFFTLGRFSGIASQKSQQSLPASPTPTPISDPILSRAGTLKIAVGTKTKYLLALKSGELVVLNVPAAIDLSKYKDKQVLVTGIYNKISNVLAVSDIAEVQIFNPTIIPSPIPSPESSSSAK